MPLLNGSEALCMSSSSSSRAASWVANTAFPHLHRQEIGKAAFTTSRHTHQGATVIVCCKCQVDMHDAACLKPACLMLHHINACLMQHGIMAGYLLAIRGTLADRQQAGTCISTCLKMQFHRRIQKSWPPYCVPTAPVLPGQQRMKQSSGLQMKM